MLCIKTNDELLALPEYSKNKIDEMLESKQIVKVNQIDLERLEEGKRAAVEITFEFFNGYRCEYGKSVFLVSNEVKESLTSDDIVYLAFPEPCGEIYVIDSYLFYEL